MISFIGVVGKHAFSCKVSKKFSCATYHVIEKMRMDVDKHPTFQESNELRETIMNKLVLKNIYFLKILKKLDVFVYKFSLRGKDGDRGSPPKKQKGT